MKKVLEFIGAIALIQGAIGLLHALTGWLSWGGVVQHIGFLDGHEVYGSIALIVLAFALFAASESVKS